MSDDDLSWFIAHPRVIFCSDGKLHDSHPRGAGSFARVLGRYMRERHALCLAAIHKMAWMLAQQLHLKDRSIAQGYITDVVTFDPAIVADQATLDHPDATPQRYSRCHGFGRVGS